MTARVQALWISLSVAIPGCGSDDGAGEGTTSTSGTTGSPTTGTTEPATTTPADETSTGMPTDPTTTGATTDPADTTAAESEGGSTEDTGTSAQCADLTEENACNMTPGCSWIGSPNQGDCVPTGDMCNGIMFEMQCNFTPSCVWNAERRVCMGGA